MLLISISILKCGIILQNKQLPILTIPAAIAYIAHITLINNDLYELSTKLFSSQTDN